MKADDYKAKDYSKIENQIGCGYCAHEETCKIRSYWKNVCVHIPLYERYENAPFHTCGYFIHHSNIELRGHESI
ncbi:MAG: hypothetical protein LBI03_11220 [Clostridiales bacterium]|jgi:hypothetical protein|nr:hypothetical protein [Clostridiales bacterium]